MARRKVSRALVLQKMLELAVGRANDVVRLAYLAEGEEIGGLELGCLKEFRRGKDGAVEIELVDRGALLEKVLDRLEEENGGGAAFLEALGRPAAPDEICSAR